MAGGGGGGSAGLRRSRRLQKRPPAPTVGEGGGNEDDGGMGTSKRVRLDTGTGRENEAGGGQQNDLQGEATAAGGEGTGAEASDAGAGADPGEGDKEPVMTSQQQIPPGNENASAEMNEEPVNGEGSAGLSEVLEGPGQEEEAHPCLFNENILDTIFKFIIRQPGSGKEVATDVKSIRLVCHSWSDSVTRLYRRTEVSAFFALCDPKDGRARISLGVFMATMEHSSLIPLQKFIFFGDIFFAQRNLKLFNDFIRICGPEMVALKFIFYDGVKHVDKLNEEKINISDWSFMKLTMLEFFIDETELATSSNTSSDGLRTLVGLFLAGAKKLSDLCVYYMTTIHSTETDPLLRQLGDTICSQVSTSLKVLHLRVILSEDAISQLAGRGFKLETFTLSYASGLGGGALLKFLESQANTLTRVYLSHRYPDQEEISLELPRLPKLTHLDLVDRIAPPFSFGGSFPKLYCLNVSSMRDGIFSELLGNSRKMSASLQSLHLPSSFRLPGLVKDLPGHFPNLVDLEISLNSVDAAETLGQVFLHCGSVQVLTIAFGNGQNLDLDSILTGVAQDDCKRLQRRSLRNVNLETLQQRPCILNLTKLWKLTLRNTVEWNRLNITNFTAQFAFLRMAQLRELDLVGIGMQISPRCMGQLEDKLILTVRMD